MVPQNMVRKYEVKRSFFLEKKIEFEYSFDVTKFLQQIEIRD